MFQTCVLQFFSVKLMCHEYTGVHCYVMIMQNILGWGPSTLIVIIMTHELSDQREFSVKNHFYSIHITKTVLGALANDFTGRPSAVPTSYNVRINIYEQPRITTKSQTDDSVLSSLSYSGSVFWLHIYISLTVNLHFVSKGNVGLHKTM